MFFYKIIVFFPFLNELTIKQLVLQFINLYRYHTDLFDNLSEISINLNTKYDLSCARILIGLCCWFYIL